MPANLFKFPSRPRPRRLNNGGKLVLELHAFLDIKRGRWVNERAISVSFHRKNYSISLAADLIPSPGSHSSAVTLLYLLCNLSCLPLANKENSRVWLFSVTRSTIISNYADDLCELHFSSPEPAERRATTLRLYFPRLPNPLEMFLLKHSSAVIGFDLFSDL